MNMRRRVQRWTQQPQGAAPVASSGLAASLLNLWALNVAGDFAIADSTGRSNGAFGTGSPVPTGNIWLVGEDGYYVYFNDAGTGTADSKIITLGVNGGPANGAEFTAFFRVGGGSSGRVYVGTDYGALQLSLNPVQVTARGAVLLITGSAPVGSGAYDVAVTRDATGTVRLYVQGALDGSASYGAFNASCLYQISLDNGSGFYRGAMFNRALAQAEIESLGGSGFWQLFAPQRIWVPVSAGGGIVVPTLSLPTVTNVTQTTARPRVTLAFPS